MGAAIRHAITKLENQDAHTKIMFLVSDGRPQDRGTAARAWREEYAVHDTHMALVEARQKTITPFCLTVDKAGHDYLKSMCGDMGYEVLGDIWALPRAPAHALPRADGAAVRPAVRDGFPTEQRILTARKARSTIRGGLLDTGAVMPDLKPLIGYIVDQVNEQGGSIGRTALTELVYLVDVEHCRQYGKPATGLKWWFHHYGPYAAELQSEIQSLGLYADEEVFRRKADNRSVSGYRYHKSERLEGDSWGVQFRNTTRR